MLVEKPKEVNPSADSNAVKIDLGVGKPLKFNGYCDPECPYFEAIDIEHITAKCKLLNKNLEFYDWFLAECD